jgi:uridylate kinase
MEKKFSRILLKISGEQLAGEYSSGIDPNIVAYFADEVKRVVETGCEVVVVVGGGNMVRGAKLAGHGIHRVTADQMGMLSGLMNAMATTDIFESRGLATRCLSNIFADQVAESYSFRRATKHLDSGRVVVVGGGIARPYFTHDTGAVSLGLELDCQVVIKATKVDGVYNKDPAKFSDARQVSTLSYQEAVENKAIAVMDKAALGLALEQKMPLIIYDSIKPGNLLKIVQGEPVGTRIG